LNRAFSKALNTDRLRLIFAIMAVAGGVGFPKPIAGQILPPAKRTTRVRILQGPELESCTNNEAIIRWTSNNPGGTDEHFGIVNYGADPEHLDQIAKSHIRLNQNHPDTVFRVRLGGLKPAATYYYRVDSMEADGTRDGVKSPVSHFTTPAEPPANGNLLRSQ
jgi:phosphodiesterase/alkaline phosphatase D-like protein